MNLAYFFFTYIFVVQLQVPGRVQLKTTDRCELDACCDRPAYRRLPYTNVSRLQAVQAAVDHQLEEMMKETPNKRVALVTFGFNVSSRVIY